jgi:hypothetical protein
MRQCIVPIIGILVPFIGTRSKEICDVVPVNGIPRLANAVFAYANTAARALGVRAGWPLTPLLSALAADRQEVANG